MEVNTVKKKKMPPLVPAESPLGSPTLKVCSS